MWFPEGVADANAIVELESASDRGAAIIVGALLEDRIRQLLEFHFAQDGTKHKAVILKGMLSPDRPLGTYKAKIDLACLLGYLSDDAHRELVVIARIRNKFAHDTDHRNFSSEKFRDLVGNLKLIDGRLRNAVNGAIGIVTSMSGEDAYGIPQIQWFLTAEGGPELLRTPRARFIWTAQLFNAAVLMAISVRHPPEEDPTFDLSKRRPIV